MSIDELLSKCNDYNIINKVSILKPYSSIVNCDKIIYLHKRNIIKRIVTKDLNKYEVFQNVDLEYGKITNYKTFKIIDDAINYFWMLSMQKFNIK